MTTTRKALSSLINPLLVSSTLICASTALGQQGTTVNDGDWNTYYGGDWAHRYSPLDQINADNVSELELAWSFSTENFGTTVDYANPSTPLEIDGVLYANIANTSPRGPKIRQRV